MNFDNNEQNSFQQENTQQNNFQNDGYNQNNPYQQNSFQPNPYQQNPYQQNSYPPNQYQPNGYPQYGQQPYQQPKQHPKNGFCIASLVLGIIATCIFCLFYLSIPLAILSLIFGIIANNAEKNGLAKAGIVLSIVSLFLCVAYWAYIITVMPEIFNDLGKYYQYY